MLVKGAIFGLHAATLVVDCKQWKARLDVADVEAFLAFLDDVGADLGLLVTTTGYSAAAKKRAHDARGARAEVLTLAELEQWSPRGTIHVSYRLPAESAADARAALVRAGLRVREDSALEHAPYEIVLQAYRFQGMNDDPGIGDVAQQALASKGIVASVAASGTTMDGGTPAHRWLEVADLNGQPLGLKILVSNEAEIDSQLRSIAGHAGIPRNRLDALRPVEWPITGLFGLPQD